MLTSHIVTSRDGVRFSSQFYSRTEEQARIAKIVDLRYAVRYTATELEAREDYVRLGLPRSPVQPSPRNAAVILFQDYLAEKRARDFSRSTLDHVAVA